MPIALCNPVRSFLWGINVIVTSPGVPFRERGAIGIRCMLECFRRRGSSHFGRVTTLFASKYFHLLMAFAAAGSARTVVFPLRGSVVRVCRWQ
jgi:hypothetical protein